MIITKDGDFFVVKVFREYLGDFDLLNREKLLLLFEKIFSKLKQRYQLNGLVDVDVYFCPSYGLIMEIQSIYSGLDEEIDMKIRIHMDTVFLNEIDLNEFDHYSNIYYYKGKFFGIFQDKKEYFVHYRDSDEIMEKGIRIC